MLGIRECNLIDEALADGFSIVTTIPSPDSQPQSPLGQYDKVFRLLQRQTLTDAEAEYIHRFTEKYPDDFYSLLTASGTRTGMPNRSYVERHAVKKDLDEHEMMLLNASGRGTRVRPRN